MIPFLLIVSLMINLSCLLITIKIFNMHNAIDPSTGEYKWYVSKDLINKTANLIDSVAKIFEEEYKHQKSIEKVTEEISKVQKLLDKS